jgi:phage gp29-like protein
LRTQAQTLDRNGLGVPIYTSPPDPEGLEGQELLDWRKKDRETGLKLATQYRGGTNSGAALSHGSELELKGVTGKLPDALPQIRYHDLGIGRAVLAQFLNLGGDDSTGSYALGDVFADFFVQSLQTVAQDVRDVTNQHVIEDLVDLNFGVDVPAPRLVFEEIGSRHAVTAEAIRALVECGALTLDEPLERHLRRTYNLPAADPGTRRTSTNPTTEESA